MHCMKRPRGWKAFLLVANSRLMVTWSEVLEKWLLPTFSILILIQPRLVVMTQRHGMDEMSKLNSLKARPSVSGMNRIILLLYTGLRVER